MIVRKYIVDDIKEALTRAKYELGPEAVILTQRNIKVGRGFSLFKKSKIEVIIGIEESKIQKNDLLMLDEVMENNPIFLDASDEIKERLFGYCKLNQLDWKSFSREDLFDFIGFLFGAHCFENQTELKKMNVLIGPTGVGKTTNLAKLAAREKLLNKKEVGILTIDTYKIGGIEQIQSYANILDIPFAVVENFRDIKEKVDLFKRLDTVLVDTVGISQNNSEDLKKLNKYLSSIRVDKKIILSLSVSTEKEIMRSMLENYKPLDYDSILLTKFDELVNYKNFWDLLEIVDRPVDFFSTGEMVPEDIYPGNLTNVIDYIENNTLKKDVLN